MLIHKFYSAVLTILLICSTSSFIHRHSLSNLISSNVKEYLPKPSPSALFGNIPIVPYYPDKKRKDYMWLDIYNAMGRDRTLFISRYIDDEACNTIIASLIWLESQSREPITFYFNVPGGLAKPTFAVYDMMKKLSCPLITVNVGLTVGLPCLLCAAGTKGSRSAFPNARFLLGKAGLEDGIEGNSQEVMMFVQDVLKDNDKALEEFAKLCHHPLSKIQKDFRRDFYLTAPEASQYGLIDAVNYPSQPIKMMTNRGNDTSVIQYGHYSEQRKVKAHEYDVVKIEKDPQTEYEERQALMKKMQLQRRQQQEQRPLSQADRFANSRKPIPVNGGDDAEAD